MTLTATPSETITQAPQTELDPVPLVAYGSGSKRTARFTTNNPIFEVAYTYDCSKVASPSTFVANLYRNGDNVGPIADDRHVSGRGVAALGNGIATFYIVVDTACAWTVVVVQGNVPDYY